MVELFRKKHEVWLKFLFGSFALPRGEAAEDLYDFAQIEYRHLKWMGQRIVESGGDFDWDRGEVKIDYRSGEELYGALSDELMALELLYPPEEDKLLERMKSDERYMLRRLRTPLKVPITAFDRHLHYKNLDKKSLDALVLFLIEESYKEYELIVTYTYSQLHSDDASISLVFEDLIYESLYHLKSFALLMAKLGILSVPRVVMKEVYKFDDLKKFLLDGIEEEKAAKEQCRLLSEAVDDRELSHFFDYINSQEEYHIELMEKVLQRL
ncbi:MAG: iron-binding protein [Epsilonproteobacteria bacterium]|nr:iron-binding protein [Campylobacterota bacterium]NPA56918.1 iron-binding protein [Campylobacterota bacterium]